MSLNDMRLPLSLIGELYSSSLVETGEIAPASKPIPVNTVPVTERVTIPTAGIRSLGNNNKQVLVMVNTADAVHLPDTELQFLTNMLTACKLSLADVAIVNLHEQHADYKAVLKELPARCALLFGVEPAGFGLPMSFPFFQIQPFAGCSFLYTPSLTEMENDKVLKSKLWVSIRRLFNI